MAAGRAPGPILLAALLAVAGGPALARRVPPLCPTGRFLVPGGALVPGGDATAIEAVVVAAPMASLASGCPAAPAHFKATPRGTRVKVTWPACPGLAGKAVLKALVHPDCRTLEGVFRARRLHIKREFVAPLSVCGDGTSDRGKDEECDTGDPCPGGGICSETCTCLPAGVTTTTLPSPCGNGTVDPGEQCDDGNTVSGDGCGATCQDEATQVNEVEPNNFAAQANTVVALPVSVLAAVNPRTDLDYFAITATAGTRLRLQTFDASGVTCNAVDTYLELCDTDGVTALASSGDGGIGTCSLIDGPSLPRAGTYFARVLSANASSIPAYRLRISRLP